MVPYWGVFEILVVFTQLSPAWFYVAANIVQLKEALVLSKTRTARYLTRQHRPSITSDAILLNDEDSSTEFNSNRWNMGRHTVDVGNTVDLTLNILLGSMNWNDLVRVVRLVDCRHLNSMARLLRIILNGRLNSLTVIGRLSKLNSWGASLKRLLAGLL